VQARITGAVRLNSRVRQSPGFLITVALPSARGFRGRIVRQPTGALRYSQFFLFCDGTGVDLSNWIFTGRRDVHRLFALGRTR
jgi:hypothetical protein